MAHDQRIGDEAWAWLSAVPDEALDRDWQRVTESMAVTLDVTGSPASQRIGDLVVYCGAGTGVLAGVGEIVGRRQAAEDAPGRWRLRVLPRVVLDRTRAPSIAEVGIRPQSLHMGLDSDPYLRLRELVLSAAVPLVGESSARAASVSPTSAGEEQGNGKGPDDDDRTGDEPWAWLAAVHEDDLDRDWSRVMERIAVTLDASSLPALQRVGDLVVYCGSGTGVVVGVGEVVGEPQVAEGGGPTQRRLRVLPRLLLDRTRAPSIADLGMRPRSLQLRLDPDPYERLRQLVLSAALPLGRAIAPRSERPF